MEGLRATYAVHLRLIGKPVVDFLFVLTELFHQMSRLRRYERISIGSRRFWRSWSVWAKISDEGDIIPNQPLLNE